MVPGKEIYESLERRDLVGWYQESRSMSHWSVGISWNGTRKVDLSHWSVGISWDGTRKVDL